MRTFQPYLYEPVSRYQSESSYDNEPTQIRPSAFTVLLGENIRLSFVFVLYILV